MCNEWKLGPCTIKNKEGVEIPGTVLMVYRSEFLFRIKGSNSDAGMNKSDWTPTYPTPPLPDKIGSVIESGGVRFMLSCVMPFPWISSTDGISDSAGRLHTGALVQMFCASHGGFKVLLEGKE